MGMRNLILRVKNLHDKFFNLVSYAQTPFLLFVRLYWGWQISQNGWGKLHNLPHVTEFFAGLGLPAPGPTAIFVATFEFIGGILLAIGLLSRVAALGFVIDMTMAYITADREALLSFWSAPEKFYGADPFIFLFVGLLILIFGPGKIAVDTLLGRWLSAPEEQAVGSAPN
jgi:putative oxidoreductase